MKLPLNIVMIMYILFLILRKIKGKVKVVLCFF